MTEEFLAFDIETVPLPFEGFSESQQEYLLRRAETEEEKDKKMMEMALSPLTAMAVCIGLKRVTLTGDKWEEENMAAYSTDLSITGEEYVKKDLESGSPCYLSSEATAISTFWKILDKYKNSVLVSFNGRGFDAPFLMIRSALLGIRPTRNLMAGTKFNYPQHIDLIDELTFFQGGFYGATKRFNFDFYARAFGITSPKSEGIDGSKVPEFFADGKILEISEYCLRDVEATWKLYIKWREYLKF